MLECDYQLLEPDLKALAAHDGFASLGDFRKWFSRYPKKEDFYLIEWDDFRKGKA